MYIPIMIILVLNRYVKSKIISSQLSNEYYEMINKLKFDSIVFPTPNEQIDKYEKHNENISINDYGVYYKIIVYPLRVCDYEICNHFDVLFTANGNGVNHYCYVSNFSRLISY